MRAAGKEARLEKDIFDESPSVEAKFGEVDSTKVGGDIFDEPMEQRVVVIDEISSKKPEVKEQKV